VPPEPDAAALIQRLAVELAECRLRGIERLDLRTHNQNRVAASDLQRLAQAYTAAEGLALHGRTAQIKQLLWDAIAAMADDREPAATLVRDLLFGDPPPMVEVAVIGGPVRIGMVTKSAGDLLDQAFQRSGMTRARFDEQRKAAFLSFGEFLVAFCAQFLPAEPDDPVDPADAEGILVTRRAEDHGGPGPHSLRTGHVHDGRFVELLSEAVNATIVGFTNEHLTGYLARALDRKIALQGPGAFWGSLRVVFCSNRLLEAIIDERLDLPDRGEAVRQRRFAAFYGRRSLTVFLRRKIRAARWPIYESPFLPQFAGTLFELPNGQRVVHLLIRSPQRTSSEHMYLELAETPDQYLTRVFEDIVANSATDNTIIPVGIPRGGGFERTGTRYRHNVLIDHSGATGWLPYVLVVTWRRRGDHAEPLLQLRTPANSERELDRLTHPVTHIYQEDYDESPSGAVPVPPPRIDLTDLPPQRAARRRLGLEAGEDFPTELVPEGITQYLHHDREHLFFFVYSREVPQDFQFPRQADMHPVPFAELLVILENQALRKAELLLRASPMSNRARFAAAEIVALNLTLHGHAEIAEQLAALAAQRQQASDRFAATIGQLIEQTRQEWVSGGREIDVLGLSGLHYREFFSTLLPLYARLGVPGAADYLASLKADDARSAAVARLAELYHDVDVITDIPAEL
jgi:hypothetical protein